MVSISIINAIVFLFSVFTNHAASKSIEEVSSTDQADAVVSCYFAKFIMTFIVVFVIKYNNLFVDDLPTFSSSSISFWFRETTLFPLGVCWSEFRVLEKYAHKSQGLDRFDRGLTGREATFLFRHSHTAREEITYNTKDCAAIMVVWV